MPHAARRDEGRPPAVASCSSSTSAAAAREIRHRGARTAPCDRSASASAQPGSRRNTSGSDPPTLAEIDALRDIARAVVGRPGRSTPGDRRGRRDRRATSSSCCPRRRSTGCSPAAGSRSRWRCSPSSAAPRPPRATAPARARPDPAGGRADRGRDPRALWRRPPPGVGGGDPRRRRPRRAAAAGPAGATGCRGSPAAGTSTRAD